ncbi:hypothetical protein ACOMHN_031091 [Nucella lapillus]
MAKIIWCCVLLLLTAVPLYHAASTGGGGGVTGEQAVAMVQSNDGSLVTESATLDSEEGEVNETSVTDPACHFYISVTSSNTTNTTVVDDMDDDTEIVLISSSPDVCFVRRVENATQTCLSNKAANEENSTVSTTESNFVPGDNLTLSDLPTFLQSLCVNHTITELVLAEDSTDSDPATTSTETPSTGGRKKRWISHRYCCTFRTYYVHRCRYTVCCSGWGWWRRCHRQRSCYWTITRRYSCGYYCGYYSWWGRK